ncbi:MAG: hypothetical protein C0594_08605 [Marinilabiliales bacterium]|nr:MAG: hypothetical protein C0594_08605 [Marinilabiliales bacterium]
MKKSLLFLLCLLIINGVWSQIPSGYYDSAEGLTGDALKEALHEIIDNHYELSYDDLPELLEDTDEDPNNSNNVILLYTGRSQSKSSFGGGADDWNREHVWAKSHGDFGESKPCGTDAHHIRPTDASVNSSRGNLDFDNGGNYHSEATQCRYDSDSWEPRDAVKGDVARMILYMDVRYEGDNGELNLELVDAVNTDPNPLFGKKSVLLQWHEDDPPDDFERHRNDVIYGVQGNRNPFIDRPEFVDLIYDPSASIEEKAFDDDFSVVTYPNPAKDVLYISGNNVEGKKFKVTFINAIGSPVKTVENVSFDKRTELKINDLRIGAYFVKFESDNRAIVKRLVVNK